MADKIITHPATDEYRAGYDRIFGNRLLTPKEMNEVFAQAIDDMDRTINASGRPIHGLPATHPARGLLCRDSTA